MKTIRCPQCNLVNWTTIDFCKRCSFDLTTLRAAGEEVAATVNFGAAAQTGNYQISAQMPPVNYAPQMPPNYQQQTQSNHQQTPPPPNYQNAQQQNRANQNHNQPNFGQQNYDNGYSHNQDRGNYQRTNQNTSQKLAIFSLITGIYSFPLINFTISAVLIGILGAIAGTAGLVIGVAIMLGVIPTSLISGIVALTKAKRYPNKFGGKGLAITGICSSAFSLVSIPVVAAIAIPNLLAARRSANEGSAISSINTIVKAQNTYMSSMPGQCGDLQTLLAAQLVDATLAKGEKSGYRFTINKLSSGSCELHATPSVNEGVSKTGIRSFYAASDQGWTIHAANKNGKPAGRNDPEL